MFAELDPATPYRTALRRDLPILDLYLMWKLPRISRAVFSVAPVSEIGPDFRSSFFGRPVAEIACTFAGDFFGAFLVSETGCKIAAS